MKFTISKLSLLSSAICLSLFSACGSDDSSSAIADDNVLSSSSQEIDGPKSSSEMSNSEGNGSSSEEVSSSSFSSSSVQSTDIEEDDVKPVHPVVDISFGTLTDERDGKTYKTVSMGEQTYMAENLNYNSAESFCYNNKSENCDKYGRLYTRKEALKVCPEGWHLPSFEEYAVLIKTVDSSVRYDEDWDELHSMILGLYLKTELGWDFNSDGLGRGHGNDLYGFSALPSGAGMNDGSKYDGLGKLANYWTSSVAKEDGKVYILYIGSKDQGGLGGFSDDGVKSVRCIKDEE